MPLNETARSNFKIAFDVNIFVLSFMFVSTVSDKNIGTNRLLKIVAKCVKVENGYPIPVDLVNIVILT